MTFNNLRGFRIFNNEAQIRIYKTSESGIHGGNYGDIQITINDPGQSTNTDVEVTSNPLILNDVDGALTMDIQITATDGPINNINLIEVAITNNLGTVNITDQGGGIFRITTTNTSSNSTGPNFRLDVIGKSITNYSLDFISYTASDVIPIPLSRDLLVSLDDDGDGQPNHLDLDSDGDGCSDAFEAGSTTNTTPLFHYTNTNVGNNGLSNDIETNDLQSAVHTASIDTSDAYNSSINTCL